MLDAQILIDAGEYDAAIAKLGAWDGETEWARYAKFNVGVALVRVRSRRTVVGVVGHSVAVRVRTATTRRAGRPAVCRQDATAARAARRPFLKQSVTRRRLGRRGAGKLQPRTRAVDGAARTRPPGSGGTGVDARDSFRDGQARLDQPGRRSLPERDRSILRRNESTRSNDRTYSVGRVFQRICCGRAAGQHGLVLASRGTSRGTRSPLPVSSARGVFPSHGSRCRKPLSTT